MEALDVPPVNLAKKISMVPGTPKPVITSKVFSEDSLGSANESSTCMSWVWSVLLFPVTLFKTIFSFCLGESLLTQVKKDPQAFGKQTAALGEPKCREQFIEVKNLVDEESLTKQEFILFQIALANGRTDNAFNLPEKIKLITQNPELAALHCNADLQRWSEGMLYADVFLQDKEKAELFLRSLLNLGAKDDNRLVTLCKLFPDFEAEIQPVDHGALRAENYLDKILNDPAAAAVSCLVDLERWSHGMSLRWPQSYQNIIGWREAERKFLTELQKQAKEFNIDLDLALMFPRFSGDLLTKLAPKGRASLSLNDVLSDIAKNYTGAAIRYQHDLKDLKILFSGFNKFAIARPTQDELTCFFYELARLGHSFNDLDTVFPCFLTEINNARNI